MASCLRLFTSLTLTCLGTPLIMFSAEGGGLQRSDFPHSFIFGASTSAYQYEGAAFEDGKGIGIWDNYTHEGNVMNGTTGDTAADGYHRYKEDVKLLSETGFDAFRFSISWTRLIPDGRGKINPRGLQFYNDMINELLDHDIQPHVTLNHFDLPQTLEDEYGGWISPRIVEDFVRFAEVCFREFGGRVKYWMTINEPNAFAQLGYSEGLLAPKHCSLPSTNCRKGNSTTEPYLAAHYMLLAHSAVVKLYRNKYQDLVACQRILDFQIGWIMEPLLYGHYPQIMQKIVGNRLPKFRESQKRDLINSFDFIGLNHYSTLYASDSVTKRYPPLDCDDDASVAIQDVNEDEEIEAEWSMGFGSVPLGFRNLLEYMKDHYGNPPVIITECGYASSGASVATSEALNDTGRVSFYSSYLEQMLQAIRNGSNAKGFLAWSLMDGFEYAFGYDVVFGLYHVNFTDLNRQPKRSAKWFQQMLLPEQGLSLSM
eukprot:TRINITY_DN577_c0_g1_i5.p1 TRINITY_DN577_c0_g1~~TRINITY_DN577_c0_g1_i5.p1  ORF type:complete len:483 (-),score=59.74 TRINITY_DN577_c0_g1_i5:335-1783(-)